MFVFPCKMKRSLSNVFNEGYQFGNNYFVKFLKTSKNPHFFKCLNNTKRIYIAIQFFCMDTWIIMSSSNRKSCSSDFICFLVSFYVKNNTAFFNTKHCSIKCINTICHPSYYCMKMLLKHCAIYGKIEYSL